jgi:hypothetical protein
VLIPRRDPPTTETAGLQTSEAISPASAEDCECATEEWQERKRAHDEAKRAAEPKDPQWAYAVEQEIHERLTEHAEAFVAFSVECRTTWCEIRATGATPESEDIFNSQILDGALAKKPFELTNSEGTLSSSNDGTITIYLRIMRAQRR